jgi:hypothetical protein
MAAFTDSGYWSGVVSAADTNSQAYNQYLFATGQGLDTDRFRQYIYLPLVKTGQWSHYLQLLRSKGWSTSKDSSGNPTPEDVTAVKELVQRATISDTQSWLSVLENAAPPSKKSSAVDTTPTYNKTISSAMKFIDATDAQQTLGNAWFAAFGGYPGQDQVNQFMSAFNTEMKNQEKNTSTTTDYVTTKVPVLDKNGKQTINKITGLPVYKDVTTTTSVTKGEGFTTQEQQQFLADYISKNFNVKNSSELAGNSKSIYDSLVGAYSNNYLDTPDFVNLAGTIKNILDNPDATAQKATLDDYITKNIRAVAAKKYAGIANELLAGGDTSTFTQPLSKTASKLLETQIDATDPLIIQALNMSDGKGGFRVANDNEFTNLMKNDKRYSVTSTAKHDAISMADAITQRLGR